MIKFTCAETNTPLYLNPTLITEVNLKSSTVYIYVGGRGHAVKETEDEVISKIYGTKFNTLTRTGNYDRL